MKSVLRTFSVYPSDRCGGMDYLENWAITTSSLNQGSPVKQAQEKNIQELLALAADVDRLITLHRNTIERLLPQYLIQYAVMCKGIVIKQRSEYECEQLKLSFWATRKTMELNFDC